MLTQDASSLPNTSNDSQGVPSSPLPSREYEIPRACTQTKHLLKSSPETRGSLRGTLCLPNLRRHVSLPRPSLSPRFRFLDWLPCSRRTVAICWRLQRRRCRKSPSHRSVAQQRPRRRGEWSNQGHLLPARPNVLIVLELRPSLDCSPRGTQLPVYGLQESVPLRSNLSLGPLAAWTWTRDSTRPTGTGLGWILQVHLPGHSSNSHCLLPFPNASPLG